MQQLTTMPVSTLLASKHTKKTDGLGVTQAEDMFTICWFSQALELIVAERLKNNEIWPFYETHLLL